MHIAIDIDLQSLAALVTAAVAILGFIWHGKP